MLTYSFKNIGSDSLYEYLYKCIKTDILNGNLLPDYKLPSKRSFAKNLGISVITVENAYAQLVAEGYIYSMPKKGFFVSDIAAMTPAVESFIPQNTQSESKLKIEKDIKISDSKNDLINISSNYATAVNFPLYTWAKLLKEVIADENTKLLSPCPSGGILQLKQAIANHLMEFRGMKVDPEQIIIGAGTEYLYSLIIQLLGNDKTFAVEDPGYRKIRLIYESNNVRCLCIPLDNEGINMNSLHKSEADILHLSPSHHYPTGIVTPVSRRYELLSWASQADSRYIIEDDYDSEFRLVGKPIPSLQSIDVSGKVIYINTFTKSLTPTIRISYMILPPELLKKFNESLSFYSCTVSNFEQYTLARFINNGHFEKHINRMRIYYRNQRDLIIKELQKSNINSVITIQEKDAGLHFLIKVNTGISDENLIKIAAKHGIEIICLSQYYYNKDNAIPHTFIVNYSALTPEIIPEIINRLEKCINEIT